MILHWCVLRDHLKPASTPPTTPLFHVRHVNAGTSDVKLRERVPQISTRKGYVRGNFGCRQYKVLMVYFRVNVTTGYTLVKTRHSRVPTYLQRETHTADWPTPTFTLPCPKNGGVNPATSTFLQNCTPIFRNVL